MLGGLLASGIVAVGVALETRRWRDAALQDRRSTGNGAPAAALAEFAAALRAELAGAASQGEAAAIVAVAVRDEVGVAAVQHPRSRGMARTALLSGALGAALELASGRGFGAFVWVSMAIGVGVFGAVIVSALGRAADSRTHARRRRLQSVGQALLAEWRRPGGDGLRERETGSSGPAAISS